MTPRFFGVARTLRTLVQALRTSALGSPALLLGFAAPLALLAGCATNTTSPTNAPPPVVEVKPAEPKGPPAGSAAAKQQAQTLVRSASEALNEGDEERAKNDLQLARDLDPDNRTVACLLRGLTADPVATLGRDSTSYVVRPGETMGRIAQRALGDVCEFYLLARYNGMRVPKQLAAGQTIRIPGKTPLAAPDASSARRSSETPAMSEPPRMGTSEMPRGSTSEGPRSSTSEGPRSSTGEAPRSSTGDALQGGSSDTPRSSASEAPRRSDDASRAASPSPSPPVAEPAAPTAPTIGPAVVPPPPIQPAVMSSPSRSGAAVDAAATRSAVDTHARAAQAAFRRQDLATAIREWDQVLALDPGNEFARAKRQEAVELDRRAKQLK